MASQMSPQAVQVVVWTKGEEEGEEEKMPDDDAGDAGVLANEGLIGYNVVIMLIVLLSLAPAEALVVMMFFYWCQILSTYANIH